MIWDLSGEPSPTVCSQVWDIKTWPLSVNHVFVFHSLGMHLTSLLWRLPCLTACFQWTGFQAFDILWLDVIFPQQKFFSPHITVHLVLRARLYSSDEKLFCAELGESENRVLQWFHPLRQCYPCWAKWVVSVWDLVYFMLFLEGCKELRKGLDVCELVYWQRGSVSLFCE